MLWRNLNGSNYERMKSDAVRVYETLNHARAQLSELTPHGRDYRNQDELLAAQDAHRAQLIKLEEVQAYLAALYAEL